MFSLFKTEVLRKFLSNMSCFIVIKFVSLKSLFQSSDLGRLVTAGVSVLVQQGFDSFNHGTPCLCS